MNDLFNLTEAQYTENILYFIGATVGYIFVSSFLTKKEDASKLLSKFVLGIALSFIWPITVLIVVSILPFLIKVYISDLKDNRETKKRQHNKLGF
jgi:hypothetical protein